MVMHVYFSGIGGAGIGPLALLAHQAGFHVSGSDLKQNHVTEYLQNKGIETIHIGQSRQQIAAVHEKQPIDWFVHTSALLKDQPDAKELAFCREHAIKATERQHFLTWFLERHNLEMVAIAGTHGKTTTTAMTVWLCQQLKLPISYLLPGEVSFGDMAAFDDRSSLFVYEADEYARNFLAYHPKLSIVTGIDWDHPDIYPSRQDYYDAFAGFIDQSQQTVMWQDDAQRAAVTADARHHILTKQSAEGVGITLPGEVNRQNAWEVVQALRLLIGHDETQLVQLVNAFPGVARRFERLAPNLYTDYAHTPPKIRGALQLAFETAGKRVVVVYEGLHNTRQHFIANELGTLFADVLQLYIVPSYLAREDPNLKLLAPEDLRQLLNKDTQSKATAARLDATLAAAIKGHLQNGDLVLCLSAGGAGSLDEWLRHQVTSGPLQPTAARQ